MTRQSDFVDGRPEVSDRLVDAMRAWEDWLNSGGSPVPGRGALGSIEWRAASGRWSKLGGNIWEELSDPTLGVRVDDSFRKLAPQQQVCMRTHFLWSAWRPEVRQVFTPWPEIRKIEAEHAALPDQVYERVLINAIAEMERACG